MANFGKVGSRRGPARTLPPAAGRRCGRPRAEIGIRSIAVPLVRFDGKIVAALNIGVQPEQVSAKAMIADYVPLLVREALALRERLVEPNQKPF
jgi:hypothetical protein